MSFESWLAANGYDADELKKPENAKQRGHLEAAWKAETQPAPTPAPAPAASVEDKLAVFQAESERIAAIEQIATKWAQENTRCGPDKMRQLRELQETAIADSKTDVNAFRLAMTRFDRQIGPMILTPKAQEATADVLEAALCMSGHLADIEKHFQAQTLETAHKQFRNGIGLQGIVGICARRNGWRGVDIKSNIMQAMQAAAQPNEMYASETGPSTYSLPNILSNVANKFLKVGFENVDSAWSRLAARRSFNDFKQTTTPVLTGDMQFKKLAPSGQIVHATIGETVYNNQADTYAIMIGIDRRDLINDDLGALTSVGRRLGRGAALSLNDRFWTVFLNNSSFFSSGNANVSTGGGSALGTADGAAINAAEVIFMNQTDPDGKPLGTMPRIMLVPPTLYNVGTRWMGSQLMVGSSALGDSNVYQGRYTVVTSPYMENSSYTGYSTAAWYLLADPNDMATIEVGFLNGQESPTVETEAAEFNQLGIALRGYYDFGVALQEKRAGVRSAGS